MPKPGGVLNFALRSSAAGEVGRSPDFQALLMSLSWEPSFQLHTDRWLGKLLEVTIMPLIKLFDYCRIVIDSLAASVEALLHPCPRREPAIHGAMTPDISQWSVVGVREGENAESSSTCPGEVSWAAGIHH